MLLVSALDAIIKCAAIIVTVIVVLAGIVGLIGVFIDFIRGGFRINRSTKEEFKELGTGDYYYENYKSKEVIVGEEEDGE